jgi:hypothetical protein
VGRNTGLMTKAGTSRTIPMFPNFDKFWSLWREQGRRGKSQKPKLFEFAQLQFIFVENIASWTSNSANQKTTDNTFEILWRFVGGRCHHFCSSIWSALRRGKLISTNQANLLSWSGTSHIVAIITVLFVKCLAIFPPCNVNLVVTAL